MYTYVAGSISNKRLQNVSATYCVHSLYAVDEYLSGQNAQQSVDEYLSGQNAQQSVIID